MKKAGKRSTPSRPKSPAKSNNKYEYVELNKTSLASNDCNSHFYGVIIDATFPYKVKQNRFICVLKVIDPTLNPKTKQDYAQVVIYASRFEDLPIIHRIGDIIRVHRAQVRIYQGKTQFNVYVNYKSSWALYSSDKQTPLGQSLSDGPYAFSGKKATHEKQDTAIQTALKKWANLFFSTNNVLADNTYTALNKASKASKDIDVVAKILQVFELDEYTNELKLKDASGEIYYTLALKLKFPHLKQGAVVKIRCANHDDTSVNKKILVLQHYSNIMTFINSSKLAKTVSQKVSNDKTIEKATLKSKVSMTPVILTEVDSKHNNLPVTSLNDLFHSPDNSTSTFRTCFYVTKIEPSSVNEAVKSYDKKSKKVSSAKGAKASDLIYHVQFLVKDVSTQFNNNVYRVLLYTHEGLGANFFHQKAVNLHSDSKASGKVKDSFELLTRFNSWVDAVVERRNGYYFIKDTKMVF
mmetsp:Transcript_34681/g.53152  ORF Transcript_34681/g.53152 Transcript_34681/m.53152 type:complete len:466 (-) Transcript_34681:33-1430(-)